MQTTGAVPLVEAEAVVRSLAIAMHGGRQVMLPLLQLKEFDQYTTTHSLNVAVLSMALAEFLGLSATDVRTFGIAGLLHDIGKTKIPLEVLTKPGKLTAEERALMNEHPAAGARGRTGWASDDSAQACARAVSKPRSPGSRPA